MGEPVGRHRRISQPSLPPTAEQRSLTELCPHVCLSADLPASVEFTGAGEDALVSQAAVELVGCHFWQRHTPVLFPPRHQESQNDFNHHLNSSHKNNPKQNRTTAFLSTQSSSFIIARFSGGLKANSPWASTRGSLAIRLGIGRTLCGSTDLPAPTPVASTTSSC